MSVYVGIDVHRRRSQVAVVTEDGTVVLNKNVVNGSTPFLQLIGDLPSGTPVASGAAFGWSWLADLLEDYGFQAARSRIRVAVSESLLSRSVSLAGAGSAESRGSIVSLGWRRRSSVSAAMARCRVGAVARSQCCRSAVCCTKVCSRCW
jgi:hypothetical protein